MTFREPAPGAGKDTLTHRDRHAAAVARLAGMPAIGAGDVPAAFAAITEEAAKALQVARVNLWRFDDSAKSLLCVDHYDLASGEHSGGTVLPEEVFPRYFAAIRADRAVVIGDASTDPRSAEFVDGYLQSEGVGAMLDAQLRSRNMLAGVLCIEHQGGPRKWRPQEVRFAGTLADLASMAIISAERAETERALLESQKMEAVGKLAGGVAHDFNNLLTVIQGSLETLTLDLDSCLDGGVAGHADIATMMSLAADASQRAGQLTAQLLAFGRRQVLDIQPTDLVPDLLASEALLRRLVREDIDLAFELSASDCWVACDVNQISQVWINLLVNAVEATGSGGQVVVGLDCQDGVARLTVTDSGCGMSKDVQRQLFEPFFTTKGEAGTGLGLAVSHGIVQQHGGRIVVRSSPGQGSRMTVELPLTEQRRQQPEAASVQLAHSSGARVLVVEDEPAVREVVETFLRNAGHQVVLAAHAAAAREHLSQEHFDLMVTDVVMPGESGPSLAAAAVALQPGLRVLLMSGYSQEVLTDVDASGRSWPLLAKPFRSDELLAQVDTLLAG